MNNYLAKKKETEWHTVQLPRNGVLFIRSVDKKIMQEMPTKTETFVERSAIQSVIDRMVYFVLSGK